MDINTFYTNYELLIATIFVLVFTSLTYTIYKKISRLHKFSNYYPLKLLKTTFLLYGIGVLIRYLRITLNLTIKPSEIGLKYLHIVDLTIISIAGFLLLYSLLWKKFHNILIPNLMSTILFILAILSVMTEKFIMTYLPQVIFFMVATLLALKNFTEKKTQIARFFLLAMALNLLNWSAFLIGWIFLDYYPKDIFGTIYLTSYIVTLVVFSILARITHINLKEF